MMVSLSAFLLGFGTLISGVAAWVAVASKRRAQDAVSASPAAQLGELRVQVQAVLEAHDQGQARHAADRASLESSLRDERLRADLAQKESFQHLADLAGLRIDLAAAQAEINELRARIDALTSMRDIRP